MHDFFVVAMWFPVAFVLLWFASPERLARIRQAVLVGHYRRVRRAEFERHRAEFRRRQA